MYENAIKIVWGVKNCAPFTKNMAPFRENIVGVSATKWISAEKIPAKPGVTPSGQLPGVPLGAQVCLVWVS